MAYNEMGVKNTHMLLKWAYGLVVLVVGLDKVFGTWFVVDWGMYVNPSIVPGMIPLSVETFIMLVGVIEIVVAVMLLTRWTKLGAWISVVWLLLIAVNLLTLGYIDIAARDVLLAVGAVALALLEGAKMKSA